MLINKSKAAENMWQLALLTGNTIPEIMEEKNVEFFKTYIYLEGKFGAIWADTQRSILKEGPRL